MDDVLIVGAGAPGLTAAEKLAAADLRVHVLEARDRIGGRIFTIHESDTSRPIELGAEFVHGIPPYDAADMRRISLAAILQSEKVSAPF